MSNILINDQVLSGTGVLWSANVAMFDGVSLHVIDNGGGSTIAVEYSVDNTNWTNLSSVSAKGRYYYSADTNYLRFRVSSYVSGTVKVGVTESTISPASLVSSYGASTRQGGKFLLPAGAKIAMLGTSSTANANLATSVLLQANAAGGMNAARFRDPRFAYTVWRDASDARGFKGSNYGFGSQLNTVLLPYVTEIISKGYQGIILQFSQNDLPTAASVSSIVSQVKQAALQAQSAGLGVYLVTANPRAAVGTNSQSSVIPLTNTALYRKHLDYNTALVNLAAEIGVEIIDTRSALQDSSSTLGVAKSGVSDDGLHMTPYGHWLWSAVAEPVFARTIAPGSPHNLLAGSAGNIYSNGLLAGTTGVLAGTTQTGGAAAQTGTVPDKIRFGLGGTGGTSSAACSIVTDPEEGNAFRVAYTLSGADGTTMFRTLFTDTPASSLSPIATPNFDGKWVRGFLRLFIEAGGEYLGDLKFIIQARNAGGSTLFSTNEFASSLSAVDPSGDATMNGKSFWLITEPMLCLTDTQSILMAIETQLAGTGSAIIHYSRPALREVASPIL